MAGSTKEYRLTEEDVRRVNEIAKEKFESWDWNYGKSPKFNITRVGRFDGGKMEFKLDVNKGVIESCSVYGDFFGSIDISVLSNALVGCKYNKESIKACLDEHITDNTFYNINYEELLDIIC